MKSELEDLIDAYQEEKAQLEKQISEYVEQGEYLFAHYHTKGLTVLSKTLEVLRTLHDPNFRYIAEAENRIKNCREILNRAVDSDQSNSPEAYMNYFLLQEIKESEDRIKELTKAEIKDSYDSQEVDDAIFGLVNNDSKKFQLNLTGYTNVSIGFERNSNAIDITLILPEEIRKYRHDTISQILRIGFSLQNDYLVYKYDLNRFKDSLEIKMMLSHLIYDILNYDSRYDVAELVCGE